MSSHTLYAEILNEARNRNPEASPTEILDGTLAIMEEEILPNVLRNLSLPRFPSWSAILIEKSRGRMRKKKYQAETLPEERRMMIQQVESVRRQLGWDGGNISAPTPYFSDSDDLPISAELSMSPVKKALDHEKEKPKIARVEEIGKPYQRIHLPSPTQYQILFSEEVQRNIAADSILEGVFKNIELDMRKLIDARGIETNIDVSYVSDLEIPSWKKFVVEITPSPALGFEDRMNLWTLLDLTIRKAIADLSKNGDNTQREYFDKLNKNLFVHIEP